MKGRLVRKPGKIVLILVVLLVALLVVADRVGVAAAESAISKKVSQKLASQDIQTNGSPDVTIEGFPFLTEVATGTYKAVVIKLASATSKGIQMSDLVVRATDVHAKATEVLNGQGEIKADQITGGAAIAYSSIAKLLHTPDLSVTPDNGKLKIRVPVQFLGLSINVVATGEVSVVGGKLRVKIVDVRQAGGGLPAGADGLLRQLGSQLSQDITLPALPYGLTLRSVTVANDGLRITAGAANVPISG